MPDLLLELLSEEIPARMQAKAAADLKKLVTDGLVAAGLVYEGAVAHATPRRLALHVAGVPVRSPETREERRGPRVGAPDQAIQGFLKSAGLASLAEAKVASDGKKGEVYLAEIVRPGRPAVDILAELLPEAIRGFPWPKSMRWGAASTSTASLRWVRPLQGVVATFGAETEEPEIVPFEVGGVVSGDATAGHRFHAPEPFRVRRFDDYVAALERARVVLDRERRKRMIAADAKDLAMAQGLELVPDEALLDEVAGLVECPVVLMGGFDESFLAVPPEVIRATIRANQKCFVLRRADGTLSNRFILVANLEATDGGKAIVAGNERVVRARLSDAKYFWETDQKPLPDYPEPAGKPLDQRLAKLRGLNIVFHEKFGTQGERVDRIVALAREIAPLVGADPHKAARAAELAKADLVTEVVGEFPETQGLMGKYYAQRATPPEDPDVAAAIEEHYKPAGPSDRVPTNPVSIAVALADKLDTLVGFWAKGETPTGSKDPYGLRRAALGVIRLVLENSRRLSLWPLLNKHFGHPHFQPIPFPAEVSERRHGEGVLEQIRRERAEALLAFFHDRLKVQLREQGARHDLVDAVLSGGAATLPPAGRVDRAAVGVGVDERSPTPTPDLRSDPPRKGEGTSPPQPHTAVNDDLLLIVRRVEALGRFLATPDGAALLAGYKRAANILRAEEKKDGAAYAGRVDATLLEARGLPEEKVLAHVTEAAVRHAHEHVLAEDFEAAMLVLAELRPAVDAFFDKILVNDPDPALRANRLELLARFRAATREVADFDKIAG